MHLEKLSLINFKNYVQADFNYSARLNCFVGNNGTGKTNLLDAIHYLSLTKSYFNLVDSQNIKYDAEFFMIKGIFQMEQRTETVSCSVQRNRKKKFSRNKKDYKRLAEHIGLLPVVMISPSDSAIVTEGSEERRKFMDTVISQYDRSYLDDLIHYNRALVQRNKLLKTFAKEERYLPESLELWDEQLIPPGERIFKKRVDFIQKLIPKFQKYYETISLRNEQIGLEYRSQLYNSDFREKLVQCREKDRILQYSTVGIHKDDLELKLDNRPIKRVGSQGQQKTFLVSLKFAKFDFIRDITGKQPILLLDDIFDKFDAKRVEQIIQIISNPEFRQIFITDTHKTRLENILTRIKADYKVFRINDKVTEIEKDEPDNSNVHETK